MALRFESELRNWTTKQLYENDPHQVGALMCNMAAITLMLVFKLVAQTDFAAFSKKTLKRAPTQKLARGYTLIEPP